MHRDATLESTGCRGCGCSGFWQADGKVMRKRREMEASNQQWGDAGTRARIWGGRQYTDSHVQRVGLGGLKQQKRCLSGHTPNTMAFDGRDLEWEFSSAKMHNQHRAVLRRPEFCVSLDPLPLKVRPLLNAQYFLDSCGIQFWKTKITVNVKAGQNLCYNPICCIKEDVSHKKELHYITHELCMKPMVQFWGRIFFSYS